MSTHPVRYIEGIKPEQTARHICTMATAALRVPRFLDAARALVRHLTTINLLPFAARFSELTAIWHWMAQHLRYTLDPHGIELVQGPIAQLDQIEQHGVVTEDCDGYTVMAMALLMALGYSCRVVIISVRPLHGWRHVFCEVQLPRVGWLIYDPSLETKRRIDLMKRSIGRMLRFYPHDFGDES